MSGVVSEVVRRLLRRPAIPVLVVVVTAVAIGVGTAIFAVADPVLFRPLPFRDPSRLVVLPSVLVPAETYNRAGTAQFAHILSLNDVEQMKSVIAGTGAYVSAAMDLVEPGRNTRVIVGLATPGVFDVLGVHATIGRTFDSTEGLPRGPSVALLGYTLWRSHYGGRPMLDSTIVLNSRSYTVIGVLPASFAFPSGSQVWIPLTVPLTPRIVGLVPGAFLPTVIARLHDTATLRRASQAMLVRWQQALKESTAGSPRYSSLAKRVDALRNSGAVVSLQTAIGGNTRSLVTFLVAGMGLVFLIVCANLSGVLLADGLRRRREFILYEALGAPRSRTVQRLFVENLVACSLGVISGIAIAAGLLGAFRALMPGGFVGLRTATISLRVITAAIIGTAVTTFVITAGAAAQALRFLSPELLRASPAASLTHGSGFKTRRGLVALQVGLATTLLIGALLLAKTLYIVSAVPLGIVAEPVGQSWISLGGQELASRYGRVLDIVDGIRHTPGMTQAAAANEMPLASTGAELIVRVSVTGDVDVDSLNTKVTYISPGYFETLQIPVLGGRDIGAADDAKAPKVAVVSSSVLRAVGSGKGVGTFIRLQGDPEPLNVIGIVDDVRDDGPSHPTRPHVYLPLASATPRDVAILARSTLPQSEMLIALRGAIGAIDRGQTGFGLRPLRESIRDASVRVRIAAMLSSALAFFAVLMALVGVYGVITFDIDSRYREFGIRAALGASSAKLIRALGGGISLAIAIGLLTGLSAAFVLTRFLAALVVGVSTHDSSVFAAAFVAMLVATTCAVIIPARRLLRLHPADIMRDS